MEAIESLNDDELVSLHNEYCDKCNYTDDRIYSMYEFDELFTGCSPLEIVDKIESNFNSNHNYFKFNGYGYAESIDYPDYHIEKEDIATYIDDNDDSLYNNELQDILDEYEEEDEDDEDGNEETA